MNKPKEQSIKEKLRNVSKRDGVGFNTLLESFFLERVLTRIADSRYRGNLILKGGMCLAQYLDLGRETRDLDFLLQKIDSSLHALSIVITEIVKQQNEDGIEFRNLEFETLSNDHKKYPGYRLTLFAYLGQIHQKLFIDFAVGDVVESHAINFELMKDKGPLIEERIILSAYPPDYIFAEKLEAIIHLADLNGRMKDYHDCIRIIRATSISKGGFKKAIQDTFNNRGTQFKYIPNHKEKLEGRWNSFLRKNKLEESSLGQIIDEINAFLKEIGL